MAFGIGNQVTNPLAATVTTTASRIITARGARKSVLVQNQGATDIVIGGSTVTATTGIVVPSGGGTWSEEHYIGDLYAITASGSSTDVRVQEIF